MHMKNIRNVVKSVNLKIAPLSALAGCSLGLCGGFDPGPLC